MADAWSKLIYMTLPYITLAILVLGIVYRVKRWKKLPRAKSIIFPTKPNRTGTVKAVAKDILLFTKTYKSSRALWVMAFLLHIGLLLVIMGHIRTVTEISWLWGLFNLSKDGIDDASMILGSIAGTLMLAGIILLLVRRLTPTWRFLSIFEDYYVLLILLGIVFTGLGMRWFSEIEVNEIHDYSRGVLTLSPSADITNAWFLWHFTLAQTLIIYFPFSKLVHVFSKPVTEAWTTR
ncbi:MAG: respiratory nitrate reductase subunit gamma [Dehalococcoidia bacterium]